EFARRNIAVAIAVHLAEPKRSPCRRTHEPAREVELLVGSSRPCTLLIVNWNCKGISSRAIWASPSRSQGARRGHAVRNSRCPRRPSRLASKISNSPRPYSLMFSTVRCFVARETPYLGVEPRGSVQLESILRAPPMPSLDNDESMQAEHAG